MHKHSMGKRVEYHEAESVFRTLWSTEMEGFKKHIILDVW